MTVHDVIHTVPKRLFRPEREPPHFCLCAFVASPNRFAKAKHSLHCGVRAAQKRIYSNFAVREVANNSAWHDNNCRRNKKTAITGHYALLNTAKRKVLLSPVQQKKNLLLDVRRQIFETYIPAFWIRKRRAPSPETREVVSIKLLAPNRSTVDKTFTRDLQKAGGSCLGEHCYLEFENMHVASVIFTWNQWHFYPFFSVHAILFMLLRQDLVHNSTPSKIPTQLPTQ